MYLATGAPRIFSQRAVNLSESLDNLTTNDQPSSLDGGTSNILGMRHNADGRLFVTFSYNSIYLWSTRVWLIPAICIGCFSKFGFYGNIIARGHAVQN
jgi:hypothetical protein